MIGVISSSIISIMTKKNSPIFSQRLMPAEEMLEIRNRRQRISIGMPANVKEDERCIPLTPQAVELLVNAGNQVMVETKAGERTRYSDLDYAEVGADIVQEKAEVFQCDYIIKVAPFTKAEIALLRGNQVLFSMLQLDTNNEDIIRALMQKRVTAVAFEYMKDEFGKLPVMESLSEISGIVSMTIASNLLLNSSGGKGSLFGGVTGISQASLLVLGTGTAAEYATRAAIGAGVEVKVFDNSVAKLREFETRFDQKIFTSLYYPRVLEKAVLSADVVLGAQAANEIPQFVLSEELIKTMKKGSVIIDLNASQGGSFETSRCTSLSNPTFIEYGVIHYCVPNMSGSVSRTTTISLSNILSNILNDISEIGGITHYTKSQKGFREGVYLYNGILTNKDVSTRFNIPFKDLDLLLAAF